MATLFTLTDLSEICRKKIAEEVFLHILFCSRDPILTLNRGHISNKPTTYQLDYGDFFSTIQLKI